MIAHTFIKDRMCARLHLVYGFAMYVVMFEAILCLRLFFGSVQNLD